MTVEEMLRIPLGIFERIACSLETIAASCDRTERPPSPLRPLDVSWSEGDGAPQRASPEPDAWTVTAGAEIERGSYVYADGPPFLSPDEARGLATALMRAADEAEGR